MILLKKFQMTNEAPLKSWLGHEKRNGTIDVMLVGGASFEELVKESGRTPSAVNAHIYHLRREHGLTVDRQGGILRFSTEQTYGPLPQSTISESGNTPILNEGLSAYRSEVSERGSDATPTTSIIEEVRQLQKRVAERLDAIQVRITEIDAEREVLVAELGQLMSFANREDPSIEIAKTTTRQPRGVLKDACLEALDASPDGLTSSEVVSWLEIHRPDIIPNSAPSILSRLAVDLEVTRDARGIYRRNKL